MDPKIGAAAAKTAQLFRQGLDSVAYHLVQRPTDSLNQARRHGPIDDRELGNIVTDHLTLIVFIILALVVIAALTSIISPSWWFGHVFQPDPSL
jgi:hypothetical protein